MTFGSKSCIFLIAVLTLIYHDAGGERHFDGSSGMGKAGGKYHTAWKDMKVKYYSGSILGFREYKIRRNPCIIGGKIPFDPNIILLAE